MGGMGMGDRAAMMARKLILCSAILAVSLAVRCSLAGEPVDFGREIRPILAGNCFVCHGPDEAQRKAGLRLDTREGATAERKGVRAIVPGDPSKSEILRRVSTDD